MNDLFISVLNMSLTASYVILFILVIRMFLKKAPKIISYGLWSVAAFRLVFPFSIESIFSLLPRDTNVSPIPKDIIYQQSPHIKSGIKIVDSVVSNSLPAPSAGASVNPLQIYLEAGRFIWILGILMILIFSLVSVLRLKRQLKVTRLVKKNIYEVSDLKTPFVLGMIRPKIYLPAGLSDAERKYILMHEQIHIERKDHLIKIFAFLITIVHWFNPMAWVFF